MKYLVLTEGTDEKALFDVLLKKGIFRYSEDELLSKQIFHCRQLKTKPEISDMIRQLPYEEKVSAIRIGDKLTDKFTVPKEFKQKIQETNDYHTTPEFEILLIIQENLYNTYLKFKLHPKEFAKKYVNYKGNSYDCTYQWIFDYFNHLSNESIIKLFEEYDNKRKRAHRNLKSVSELIKKE